MIAPKGEIVWASYYNADGALCFLITSKPDRDSYFLYRADDGKLIKLGKSKTPAQLIEKFNVDREIGVSDV